MVFAGPTHHFRTVAVEQFRKGHEGFLDGRHLYIPLFVMHFQHVETPQAKRQRVEPGLEDVGGGIEFQFRHQYAGVGQDFDQVFPLQPEQYSPQRGSARNEPFGEKIRKTSPIGKKGPTLIRANPL